MGKGGTVLGLIGIIIGGGGLAFGFISWNSTNTIQNNLDNFENSIMSKAWYNESYGPFVITPDTTLLEIPSLIVNFTLESNASIYLSFTCRATIFPSSGHSRVFIYFKIDSELINEPSAQVGNYYGASLGDSLSVNLQHFIENIVAGSHNVTMAVSTTNSLNFLNEMTIFVQSFT